MQNFEFANSPLLGISVITPLYAEDERGYFLKSYQRDVFEQNQIPCDLFETFETGSRRGVVRGLHFQDRNPQAKLVRAPYGEVFDVAVDLRPQSPTLGKWESFRLSAQNRQMLLVPAGFAHGFLVLSDFAVVSYCCDGPYSKETDSGILWSDRDLAIPWPVEDPSACIVSERDQKLQSFAQYVRSRRGFL